MEYIFVVKQLKNDILIKCQNYTILLNTKNLFLLTKTKIKTIDKAYNLIINQFKKHNIVIQDINNNNSIRLLFKMNKTNNFEINLLYNENKSTEITDTARTIIDKEIKNNSNNKTSIKENFNNTNQNSIIEIINDSYIDLRFDNSFCVFKSINNILYLIYSNKDKSIICYDLININKINEIKKAHDNYITNFRHNFDNLNKRDLILSISCDDNNVKLWNIYNFECLLNLENANQNPYLDSACFLNDDNKYYILTTNCSWSSMHEPIKIFDFNGKKIKEIDNSNDSTLLIDTYYDNKSSKIYILTANNCNVKSYDYKRNKIYQTYRDWNNKFCHRTIIIYENDNIIKLVESCQDGYIRIWNFHSGQLLNKIYVNTKDLIGTYLHYNKYLFVGCEEGNMKLIELNKGKIIKNFENKKSSGYVITIKKINHPNYGECLITQSIQSGEIKLWIIANIISN